MYGTVKRGCDGSNLKAANFRRSVEEAVWVPE
jgi:hypothetical protein